LRSRRTEDEGREEEVWEFYKKLREEGYSVVEATQATAIFFSRGDAPAGLLERAN
jgi:ABC-type thiamine transport system substrate-binding protein